MTIRPKDLSPGTGILALSIRMVTRTFKFLYYVPRAHIDTTTYFQTISGQLLLVDLQLPRAACQF